MRKLPADSAPMLKRLVPALVKKFCAARPKLLSSGYMAEAAPAADKAPKPPAPPAAPAAEAAALKPNDPASAPATGETMADTTGRSTMVLNMLTTVSRKVEAKLLPDSKPRMSASVSVRSISPLARCHSRAASSALFLAASALFLAASRASLLLMRLASSLRFLISSSRYEAVR